MKRILLLSTLLLAACSHSSGGSGGTAGAPFVKNLIANTSDTTEPVAIDGLDLRFTEDTAVFDDLFQ